MRSVTIPPVQMGDPTQPFRHRLASSPEPGRGARLRSGVSLSNRLARVPALSARPTGIPQFTTPPRGDRSSATTQGHLRDRLGHLRDTPGHPRDTFGTRLGLIRDVVFSCPISTTLAPSSPYAISHSVFFLSPIAPPQNDPTCPELSRGNSSQTPAAQHVKSNPSPILNSSAAGSCPGGW